MKEYSHSFPFGSLVSPPSAQELLDLAFKRSFKARGTKEKDPILAARIREAGRIASMADVISNRLDVVVRSFPSFNALHPFYRELTDVLIGVDELRIALSRLSWAKRMIRRLSRQYIRRVMRSEDFAEMEKIRKAAMGRISSIVKSISNDIDLIRAACQKLSTIPNIEIGIPTVVIAGMPNTGKSTLVRRISTGKPKIASYPFTTTSLLVGHFYLKGGAMRVQVIDTPGLLDRPLSERNVIELQAILALKHLAWFIVYMIDPTETCGYSVENQISLLDEISREFSEIKLLIVLNKEDLWLQFNESVERCKELLRQRRISFYEISAEKGTGINALATTLGREILKLKLYTNKRQQEAVN